MPRVLLFVLLAALPVACGEGPAPFWRDAMTEWCRFQETCLGSQEGIRACRDAIFEESQDPDGFAAECEAFDPDRADSCLAYLRQTADSCADLSSTPPDCTDICGPGSAIVLWGYLAGPPIAVPDADLADHGAASEVPR